MFSRHIARKIYEKWHKILAKYDRKQGFNFEIFEKWKYETSISFQPTLTSLNNNLWDVSSYLYTKHIINFFKHCAQIGQNICKISSKQDFKIFAKWETSNSFQSTHWITMFLLIRVYTKFWNLNFTLGKSWTLWLASAQKWYGKNFFKKYLASNLFSKIYCSQDIQDYFTSKTPLSMLLAKGG